MVSRVIARRAAWAIEAAQADAERQDRKLGGCQIRNHLERFTLHSEGYAEPGYDSQTGVIVTGDYNDVDTCDRETKARMVISTLPSRLLAVLEKLGVECEWSDEWSACGGCDKLFRTEPDSHDWSPSYTYQDRDLYCADCAESDEDTEADRELAREGAGEA